MRLFAALAMVLVATMASMQAQAQNRYGSIAFSQQSDGGYEWGITWNAESREAARSRAVAGCRSEGGRDCSEIFWFRNTCGALAIGSGNGWGAGSGATTVKAQRGALEKCRTTNRDCQIAVSRCAVASTTAVAQSLRYSSKREQRKLRDRYGSVAFSQQGDGGYQWGFTWDFESREVARNRAIAGCRNKGGRSCSEIFQFRNTCGALAIGGANGWGAGAGATTLEAQRGALAQCRTRNRDCQIAVSRCAKASTKVATAGRSLGSAKVSSSAQQRNVATREEPKLTQAGRRRIQQALAASGFNPGGADGVFGPKTRAALRAWQTANGYAATGQLTSEHARILQSGKRRTRPVDAPTFAEAVAAYRRGDHVTAAKGYRAHAEKGHADAQYNLGLMYMNGQGVRRDDGQALTWFYRAAKQGHALAQTNLGSLYEAGRGVQKNDSEAVRWYRSAADQGEVYAQNNLGNMYFNGRGVRQSDAEAVRWYRRAAGQGQANAQSTLGFMYLSGRGVARDDALAARWSRRAAEQGNAHAQNNLAFLYQEGRGVPRNKKQAERWYGKAAAQGHASARTRLATLKGTGKDTPRFVTPPPPQRKLPEILRAEGAEMGRVAQLLREGIDPNGRDQSADTGLHYAAGEPDPDVVRHLLSVGARCDPRNKDGNTPLHVAAGTGSLRFSDPNAVVTVRLLLECGADPNRRNSDGNTPLHTAFTGVGLFVFSSGAGDSGVVSALLRGGAKPNAKNNDGDTPLTLAVQRTDDDAKAVRLLLKHGANPNTRSRKGSAVLHLAAEEERPSVIAALLAGGAAPDAKDKQGDAALHIVVKKRRERTKDIEALLAGGAGPCVKDRKRNIPIAYPEEGSRANRLLASAGGTDWACGQKAVAEAPNQARPKEESRPARQRQQPASCTGCACPPTGPRTGSTGSC